MNKKNSIKTTLVGSLPRPQKLKEMLRARHIGDPTFNQADFDTTAREAVLECVAKQKARRIDIVSDGVCRRCPMHTTFRTVLQALSRLTLLEGRSNIRKFQTTSVAYPEHPDYEAYRATRGYGPRTIKPPICTGPLSYRRDAAVARDIDVLKQAMDKIKRLDI